MPLLKEQQMSSTSKEHVQAGDGEDKDTGGIVIFKCSKSTCHQVFLSLKAAQLHESLHRRQDGRFLCSVANCGKSFKAYFSMKVHLRGHTNERPFTCLHPECEKSFKTSSDLSKHSRTHSGERPYPCTWEGCSSSFSTQDNLRVHLRTHTGERPYKCTFSGCKKAFKSQTNYQNHTRIHTGEKPFTCPEPCCGRRFTEYSSMKKHELTHKKEKTFKCDTCGQQYKYACSLRSHMKSAHCLHEAPSKKIKTVLSAAEDLIEQDDHAINKSVYSLRSNTKVVRQKCQTGLLQMKVPDATSPSKQILETETLTVNESNCSSRSNVKPGGHKIRTPRKKVIKSSHETSSSGQHIEKQISAVNDSTSFLVTSASHHLQATQKPTKSLDVPIPIDHIVDQVIHGLPEDITYTCEDGTQIFFLVDEEDLISEEA